MDKSKEVKEAEEYYQRIRDQQIADGTYNPDLNKKPVYEEQKYNSNAVISSSELNSWDAVIAYNRRIGRGEIKTW